MNSKITSLEQTLNEKTKEIILLESQKDGLNELVKKLQ